MTNTPRVKPGPPKRFTRPSIDAPLTEAQDDGLTALSEATGATKASLVRVAVARLLASAGLSGDEEQSVSHSRISRATTTPARRRAPHRPGEGGAAYTGLRAAEIAGLGVRDVDFDAGHVEVRQTAKRIANEWTVGTPKSKRSTRTVPLLDRQLIGELKAVLLTNPNSGDPDALFWPGRANGSRRLDWTRPVDVGGVLRYYLRPALT